MLFPPRRILLVSTLLASLLATHATADAGVDPLLRTTWGQGGLYKSKTPKKDGARTYPGCTTVASAQVLYYYRYQNQAAQDVGYGLEHAPLSGDDVSDDGRSIYVDLPAVAYDFYAMAHSLEGATQSQIDETATFIYHVGITLNAQFGGGEGSSATGKQIENGFRYQWGYNNIARRKMSVISKSAFGYSDAEWAQLMRSELDAGRPVLYMAQQLDADAGHAFVIDGYDDNGLVHVNFGWGGYANGWYDPNTLEDPSGRRWIRDAMIFRGLEPEEGYAAAMMGAPTEPTGYSWNGAFSMISLASGTTTGYGLTIDEARIHPTSSANPAVFLQWEIDGRDGRKLEISADGMQGATITYGVWNDRSQDLVYRDVSLPFVLDPAVDGRSTADGEYYVIAVTFDEKPSSAVSIVAEPTTSAAGPVTGAPGAPITVDGHTWNGNGSLISYTSGTKTGYGLTKDEAQIHPDSAGDPVVFFQWEIDSRDGTTLEIAADEMTTATITYGSWDDRSKDVTRTVSLPYVLNPADDGGSVADGRYYVIKVAFDRKPTSDATIYATIR
jgi:hypothetical protein